MQAALYSKKLNLWRMHRLREGLPYEGAAEGVEPIMEESLFGIPDKANAKMLQEETSGRSCDSSELLRTWVALPISSL